MISEVYSQPELEPATFQQRPSFELNLLSPATESWCHVRQLPPEDRVGFWHCDKYELDLTYLEPALVGAINAMCSTNYVQTEICHGDKWKGDWNDNNVDDNDSKDNNKVDNDGAMRRRTTRMVMMVMMMMMVVMM